MKFGYELKDVCVLWATYTHDHNTLASKDTNEVTGYALSWLHLTNNARENPSYILHYANNSGNGVWVVAPPKHAEEVKIYLNNLGFVVWDTEQRKAFCVNCEWALSEPDYVNDALFLFEEGLNDI